MFAIRKPTPLNTACDSASGVGQPAGGVASHVPGFFRTLCRGLLGPARTGARTDAITHENKTPCAPRLVVNNTAIFHCPEWPSCGCPGGTMRPECPGLKEWRDAQ